MASSASASFFISSSLRFSDDGSFGIVYFVLAIRSRMYFECLLLPVRPSARRGCVMRFAVLVRAASALASLCCAAATKSPNGIAARRCFLRFLVTEASINKLVGGSICRSRSHIENKSRGRFREANRKRRVGRSSKIGPPFAVGLIDASGTWSHGKQYPCCSTRSHRETDRAACRVAKGRCCAGWGAGAASCRAPCRKSSRPGPCQSRS